MFIDQFRGDGFQPQGQGGVAVRQPLGDRHGGRERIRLRLQVRQTAAAEQRDAPAVPVNRGGLAPEEAARHRPGLPVNPVPRIADKGKIEVKSFYISLFPAGYKDGGGQVLGRIARDDGHQAVQVQATPDKDSHQYRHDGAQGLFRFHRRSFLARYVFSDKSPNRLTGCRRYPGRLPLHHPRMPHCTDGSRPGWDTGP